MLTQTQAFKAVKVKVASPESIMTWSHGEVTKPETINYRTQRPERDGLFDEKIFGPIKDWECFCGKYKRIRYKNIVCDKCGVEVTKAAVRRERMGHIKLAVPVTHIWYLRGVPSRLGMMLNIGVMDLEKVIYFASYIVTSVDDDVRSRTLQQIETEFKAKKKEIDQRFETIISDAKAGKHLHGKDIDKDVYQSQVDTEVTRLTDAWRAEVASLESIRDSARSELKSIKKGEILSELEYRDLALKYGPVFTAGTGTEAVKMLLQNLNLEELAIELQSELANLEGQAARKAMRRLKLIKQFINSGTRPEWMLIEALPVIPPDLRPMVQLDGGRFAASDLNDLYRRVINRNNRLRKLIDIHSPEVITRNEKRMLQEAVDALIDNAIRHGKEAAAATGQKRKLRSLADMLKGKQGRFRQNLLGKRVDYSGRSVIVVGPHLKLHQCGLPKAMALELFKPFVIAKLIDRGYAHHVRSANKLIEQGRNEVWDILEEVTQGHYVLLNRAPTLHRLGFQAFQPVLIEGKAIQLHPMVCTAFNADFDGDQMAVHVPLTAAAQAEAREIMVSANNLLKPASGEPVMAPDKDVVVGCYYITKAQEGLKGQGKAFSSPEEAILAYNTGLVTLQTIVKVLFPSGEMIETTPGRIIFNRIVPASLGYRNETFNKKKLQDLVRESHKNLGNEMTANLIDEIKRTGFTYMKKSGISWAMSDLNVPPIKHEILIKADEEVKLTYEQFQEGLLTENERYSRVIEIWKRAGDAIEKQVKSGVVEFSNVDYIVNSGGRGSPSQLTQMSGIKGLVVNPSGSVIELPCRSGFKEGLAVLEYFISTHGSRKGMSDTALRTADAGYLTRRLVDVAQDVVVKAEDCGTDEYILITQSESDEMGRPFEKRIFGRVLATDVRDGDGKVIAKKGHVIDEDIAKQIVASGLTEIKSRTVLRCMLSRGVCKQCYGFDLGFNAMVTLGAAVGIVAAQAIGEPGTQLTMRTFHHGGSASESDITQGLPRVEELFEAREPKGEALVSEIAGTAHISGGGTKDYTIAIRGQGAKVDHYELTDDTKVVIRDNVVVNPGDIIATTSGKSIKAKTAGVVKIENGQVQVIHQDENFTQYTVPPVFQILVKDGDLISRGQKLTEGNLNPMKVLQLEGTEAAQKYIVKEVQLIYSSQGQQIHDKHIEVIVRQMFSKMRIVNPGESGLVEGDMIDKARLNILNQKLNEDGKQPVEAEQLLLGIIKVALASDSFLAAASFQETTRVLIDAAVSGKTDHLMGLKENVIIGKLIPAGTGYDASIAEDIQNIEVIETVEVE